jgi:Na+-driven multidrug efflux pump
LRLRWQQLLDGQYGKRGVVVAAVVVVVVVVVAVAGVAVAGAAVAAAAVAVVVLLAISFLLKSPKRSCHRHRHRPCSG